jgi:hypothetical protein
MNARGEILARMMIGRSPRLVRLVPGAPCTADCIRVSAIEIEGRGPAYCNQGQNRVRARLTVTDEAGVRLPGVTVAGRFLDDYWLDEPVAGQTDASGEVTFTHVGPPCVGAVALLVTGATSTAPQRTLDRTTGVLTDYVIPLPGTLPEALSVPAEYVLESIAPNPFGASTTIRFGLPASAPVRLVVYDALGREVARLVDAVMEPGRHEARFEAAGLPGGVYFVRLTAGGTTATHAVTLLR